MNQDKMKENTGTKVSVDVSDLEVWYGHAQALHGISLTLEAGKINAVVGPNGAGKSSLLLAMYGAVASKGRITIGNTDISRLKPSQRAALGVGLVPQGRQVFPTLTVTENLSVMSEILGVGSEEVTEALSRFPRLHERRTTMAGNLSGGEQQMLAVARALMTKSDVILFDEMATGLAPVIVDQLLGTARELAQSGSTVVMAEAAVGLIRSVVDRGHVIMRGSIVGTAETGGFELEERYRHAMGITG